jgi:sterol 3beta-glucosyltransferase
MIHHGGAGTTASCIYNKKPMLIIPFFGDQFFWGSKINELQIGKVISYKNIDIGDTSEGLLNEAIKELSNHDECQKNINDISDIVTNENGIQNAINLIETNIQTSLVAPAYISDTDSTKCENVNCEKIFSVIGGIFGSKRHHCRNCGGCFCGDCTIKSIKIPKYRFFTPVRVCDQCYVILSNQI